LFDNSGVGIFRFVDSKPFFPSRGFLVRYIKEIFMRYWIRRLRQTAHGFRPGRPPSFRPILEGLEERSLLDAGMTGFAMGGHMMATSAMMQSSPMMMPSSMMMPSNGMMQLTSAQMGARIDAFFQMFDAQLIMLESALVARMPQLEGMIQPFNAMVTSVESAIAGHPINDLSGQV
jgi:hypothetical protein